MGCSLDSLKQIAHGLAVQFGTSCEIVIHDLNQEDLSRSIAYIENGHVSNRQTGDGPSSIVLEALKSDPAKIQDRLSYLTKTNDGRILKSSTMYIRRDNGDIAYIFSLNYDITPLLTVQSAIQPLIQTEAENQAEEGAPENPSTPTTIPQNVTELLDQLIEQAVALVGKPVALMNKDDKIAVVQYLNNAGAFLITKSGDKVSSFLGISKFTLYSYMDAGK